MTNEGMWKELELSDKLKECKAELKQRDKNYSAEKMALYKVVKKLKTENDELRLFKIKAVEEAKKEADSLMINKCLKYEDEIKRHKKHIEKLSNQLLDYERIIEEKENEIIIIKNR